MAKGHSEYYNTFEEMIDYSHKAALFLQDTLTNFDRETLAEKRIQLHAIEHSSDEVKHNMMHKLAKEFITPIEREDIIELAQEIDDITDRIEDVLLSVYMYNFSSVREESLQFADIIVKCCVQLKAALAKFYNFRKAAPDILTKLIDVNTLECEGDELYIEAVHRLYVEDCEALETFAWTRVFDQLEKCCDSCEHTANMIERIMMKNS